MKWLKRELLYLTRYAGRYSVRRLLRRIFHLFLCCLLVVNVTLVSYADVVAATSSELEDYAEYEEDEFEGIPFYYDENMNKVYDFETFPERYEVQTYSLSAVLSVGYVAFCAILSLFGIKMTYDSVKNFVDDAFIPWASKTSSSLAADIKKFVGGNLAVASTVVSALGQYLRSKDVIDTSDAENPVMTYGKYSFDGLEFTIPSHPSYDKYVVTRQWTTTDVNGYILYHNQCISLSKTKLSSIQQCGYISQYSDDLYSYYIGYLQDNGTVYLGSMTTYDFYMTYDPSGYWKSESYSTKSSTGYPYETIYLFEYPIFISSEAAKSYLLYGTTGGMLNGDAPIQVSEPIQNYYAGNETFDSDATYADAMTGLETEEQAGALYEELQGAITYEALLQAVSKYFEISRNGQSASTDLSVTQAYNGLRHIVTTLANSVDVTLTDDLVDEFISSFYASNFSGSAATVQEQAAAISKTSVAVNHGTAAVSDDVNENNYTITKGLAAALGAYLVSKSFVETAPSFTGEIANVAVAEGVVNPPAEGEEEDEKSYPWMPDISKLFGGISDQLTELEDWVSSIPDALAGIRDNVLAIPGQITDFFTIDTAPIAAAFDSLQAAFASRFPVLQQLGSIFDYQGVSFDQSAPVFKIQVPEPLKFAYPDTDEIVILDLTPYAIYFQSVRMLLVAIFWLLFARWLLQEFDIKFHIG